MRRPLPISAALSDDRKMVKPSLVADIEDRQSASATGSRNRDLPAFAEAV